MKVPLRWLQEYVDIVLPPEQLAERLTLSGTMVEGITHIGTDWDDIFVAEIVRLEPHPNADHLQLATVNLSTREYTVVTGAFNIAVGDRVPFVSAGGRLPDGKVMEASPIRGILSQGMLLAEDELGLSEDHSGIYHLDAQTPVGAPLREVLGDVVFEIDITPNRPDCLSILGIAREVAALTGRQLRIPLVHLQEGGAAIDELVTVQVNDPECCPRYTLRAVMDVTVGPSPAWLAERIRAAGLRPINNVVDISNYVMLEWGQPLHTFDFQAVRERLVVVRHAQTGETLETLDGQQRQLQPDMLLIADAARAIGIAGIMGAANSEITPATSVVLIESANFTARNIRHTAQQLGLRTEASTRFEKGLPWELPPLALDRAAALIAEICGGTVLRGTIEVAEPAPPQRVIGLPETEIARLLGVHLNRKQIIASLESLGFAVASADHTGPLSVTIPFWRGDISESANLVGEVARMLGFDNIPTSFPEGAVAAAPPSHARHWEKAIRHFLLACGLTDLMTYSMISQDALSALFSLEGAEIELTPDRLATLVPHPQDVREHDASFDLLRLSNPLTSEQEILRPTLLPNLIKALGANLRHTQEGLAFFELARCYFPRANDLPYERLTLGIAMAGLRAPRIWWNDAPSEINFYDMKGILQELLDHCGITGYHFEATIHPVLHPGRSARVLTQDGQDLGYFGEVHPALTSSLDLGGGRSYLLELDGELLIRLSTKDRRVHAVSRFPVVKRDIAVIVPDRIAVAEIIAAVTVAGGDLLRETRVFDVYRGEPVPVGYKSVACALTLQALDRTLSDFEVDRVFKDISTRLSADIGGQVRDLSLQSK